MDEPALRELLPDVFTWPCFSERHGYDFNGYLFRHASGNIAVDPVQMSDAVLDALGRLGVQRIVITNRNHTRDSRHLRERCRARLAIHPADAPHAASEGAVIDDELRVGERVGPFTVLGAAGKSAGEIALHWVERRILVIGDACVGKPPGECALLPPAVIDDRATLRRSLEDLAQTVDFDVLLPGDGAPIVSGGREALRRLLAKLD